MNEPVETPHQSERPPSDGLAIASLILGVLALLNSVFLIGSLVAVPGLILGILHLRRATVARAMAWWGAILSVGGFCASVAFLGLYVYVAYDFMENFDDFGSDESLMAWEGVIAPDMTITTLDGDTIQLSEARGRRVIIDIWATWCGPCVEEIPHFNALRQEFSEDELLIVGISDDEDAETVRDFMSDNPMDYVVAAAQSDLPKPYNAISAYPTTFFIDRNGVIQRIVVGYEDLDALREYASAPDFEGVPLTEPYYPPSTLEDSDVMLTATREWSLNIPSACSMCVGDWDQDGIQDLIVVDGEAQLHVINYKGEVTATISVPECFGTIEFGIHAKYGPRLLGYDSWGDQVTVIDGGGRRLWAYRSSAGINGAHWGDLDGAGTDEMVVGMNGGGGIHGVSPEGKRLWRNADIGNVWDQAILPATSDSEAVVIATEAGGSIWIFDASGEKIRTIESAWAYYNPMSAAEIDSAGTRQILAIDGDMAIAFDMQGTVQWKTPVAEDHGAWRDTTFTAGDVDGDGVKEWAFIEASGDMVIVTTGGVKLATIPDSEDVEEFVILPIPGGGGLLITQQSDEIVATRFASDAEQ